MNFRDEKEAKRLIDVLPFYNVPIKKPNIKRLNNVDLLNELPFYDELSVAKISKTFRGYTRSCSTEMIEPKDPPLQLMDCKSSIKDLLKDL